MDYPLSIVLALQQAVYASDWILPSTLFSAAISYGGPAITAHDGIRLLSHTGASETVTVDSADRKDHVSMSPYSGTVSGNDSADTWLN
ncbi:hypothetical protein DXG01_000586 [Tephrocybe rancida]|nr:hypothetical protein DXG01_000586 [Tephrocybe rancida]